MGCFTGFIAGQWIFFAAIYLLHRLFFPNVLQQESYFVFLLAFSALAGFLGSVTAEMSVKRSQPDQLSDPAHNFWWQAMPSIIIFVSVLQSWVKIHEISPSLGFSFALSWFLPPAIVLVVWSIMIIALRHRNTPKA